MTTLFTNIRYLVNVREKLHLLRGKELAHLPLIEHAFLLVEDDVIVDYGPMKDLKKPPSSFTHYHNVQGKSILPCWCDSHTHLVFAGSREEEFVDKINGLSYAEIAANGGGIINSAKKIEAISEDELFVQSYKRLQEVMALGTGAIEIKSGYGLSVEGELKILRVIKKLKEKASIPIKASFLGAHTYPSQYRENHSGYIDTIITDMLPVIAAEDLADYIDAFCEQGFFSNEETEIICKAGMSYGLKPKIHANQLSCSGAVQTGVGLNAVSVDHLEMMDEDSIRSLASSSTIGTLLPTAAFFLRMPFSPARKLLENNCAIALASDYNPGSSPSGNMNFVVALSCIQMRLLPQEAINAATINGAFAMELEGRVGSVTKGKKASLIITNPIPSVNYFPYAFGTNLIDAVMINGMLISGQFNQS